MNPDISVTCPAETPDFIVTRELEAPRSLVWRCWTEPSRLARWWGPRGFTCPVCEIDLREGGRCRIVLRGPDGVDYPSSGIFTEIVPFTRIVKLEDMSEHPPGWHAMIAAASGGAPLTLDGIRTTILFEDAGNGTRLTMRTRFADTATRDAFVRTGMTEGWSATIGRLCDLLDAIKASEHTITVTRLLAAPAKRVFACFSDPATIGNWWGPNGFSTTTHAMDFRVGGIWRFTMHGPDGRDYPNRISYTEIVSSRLIAYDHGENDLHPEMFKGRITFAEEAGATRLTLQLIVPDPEHREYMISFGAVEGAWETLARLAAFITARA